MGRRTNLLPVLALVLRHGAAEDVILRRGRTGREGGETFGLERRGSPGRGEGASGENLSNTLQMAGFPVIDTSSRKTGRGTPPAVSNAEPARELMRREVAKASRVAGTRESARPTASVPPSPGRRASKRKNSPPRASSHPSLTSAWDRRCACTSGEDGENPSEMFLRVPRKTSRVIAPRTRRRRRGCRPRDHARSRSRAGKLTP